MKRVLKLTENPFNSHLISGPRLYTTGEDMETKVRPRFPAIADMIAREREPYGRLLGIVKVNDAEKIAGTDEVDDFLTETATYMVGAQPLVLGLLGGENSAAYKAIFPNHKQTYTRLIKADAPAQFKAVKDAVEKWGDRLPDADRSRMIGLLGGWNDARAAQNASEGALAGSRTERDAARTRLENVMFKGLLMLTIEFIESPETVQDFLDHTLLDAHRHESLEHAAAAPGGA